MANLIELFTMTEAAYVASSLSEDPNPAWTSGATFGVGDRAYVGHVLYESATASNTGNDPTATDTTAWLKVGATNKWAPFDQTLGRSCTSSGDMSFTIEAPRICTAIGLFGLTAASVRLRVYDGSGVLVSDRTDQLVDGSGIRSWFDWYTYEPAYKPYHIIEDFTALTGYTIQIDLTGGGGGVEVGEIGIGRRYVLGETTAPATGEMIRVNPISRDDYGNISSVDRGSYERLKLEIAVTAGTEPNVMDIVNRQGIRPCIVYPSSDLNNRIPPVYGVITSAPRSWGVGLSTFELEITGLV